MNTGYLIAGLAVGYVLLGRGAAATPPRYVPPPPPGGGAANPGGWPGGAQPKKDAPGVDAGAIIKTGVDVATQLFKLFGGSDKPAQSGGAAGGDQPGGYVPTDYGATVDGGYGQVFDSAVD